MWGASSSERVCSQSNEGRLTTSWSESWLGGAVDYEAVFPPRKALECPRPHKLPLGRARRRRGTSGGTAGSTWPGLSLCSSAEM